MSAPPTSACVHAPSPIATPASSSAKYVPLPREKNAAFGPPVPSSIALVHSVKLCKVLNVPTGLHCARPADPIFASDSFPASTLARSSASISDIAPPDAPTPRKKPVCSRSPVQSASASASRAAVAASLAARDARSCQRGGVGSASSAAAGISPAIWPGCEPAS